LKGGECGGTWRIKPGKVEQIELVIIAEMACAQG
jgi:hypothetical protein